MNNIIIQWLWTVSAGLTVGAHGYVLFTKEFLWKFAIEAYLVAAVCLFVAKRMEKSEVMKKEFQKQQLIGTLYLIEKGVAKIVERTKI